MRKHRLCLLFAICYWLFANVAEGVVFFYQKPVQYAMAQTNPSPTPPLDISGMELILRLKVGQEETYIRTTGRKIIDSLINLILLQMNLEGFSITVKDSTTGKDEVIAGGELGRILRKEVLPFNHRLQEVTIKHTELVQTPGLTPQFDEAKYKGDISAGGFFDLILRRDLGRADKGFPEWGVVGITLKRYIPDSGNPPQTEELDLGLDVKNGEGTAFFSKRIYAPNGRLIKWETWEFKPGNPEPVAYKSGK